MGSTPIWLTDEDSEVTGYKRAKIPFTQTQPNKSDCPSLVRTVSETFSAPDAIPIQRFVGSAVYSSGWLTDPLQGPSLTASSWVLHAWAKVDEVGAGVGLAFIVSKYGGPAIVSASMSGPLTMGMKDVALTSAAANPTDLVAGDRLVIQILMADTATCGMENAHNVTFSYNGLYSHAEGDTYLLCPDTLTVIGAQDGAAIIGDIPSDDILAVRTLLRDFSAELGLSNSPILIDSEIIRYIIQAVETYSTNRPYVTSYLYSGDALTFDFPLPPKWIWGFSRCVVAEYPASQQIPAILEYLDWEIRDDILGTQPYRVFRLRTIVPDNNANNFYVQYTTRHSYSTEFSTIPREDQDAVMWLAAAYSATAIASKFAGATDSTIEADIINYRDSQRKWADVANNLYEAYNKRVVEPDTATPVGTQVEWRPQNQSGQPTLWHSRRLRRVFF